MYGSILRILSPVAPVANYITAAIPIYLDLFQNQKNSLAGALPYEGHIVMVQDLVLLFLIVGLVCWHFRGFLLYSTWRVRIITVIV